MGPPLIPCDMGTPLADCTFMKARAFVDFAHAVLERSRVVYAGPLAKYSKAPWRWEDLSAALPAMQTNATWIAPHCRTRNGGTMMPMRQKLLFAASCLVCTVVCWRSDLVFGGTEFGGGTLARDENFGGFLFVMAMGLIFKYPRIAAVTGLAASYVSLPLYFYLVFPRPFRQVWRGNWLAVELPRERFVWDGWWIAGIVFMMVVASICCVVLVRSFAARHRYVEPLRP
jgi:hypothetical protein